MRTADTYVRARIDTRTKKLAMNALEEMGLSISDAIRLLMIQIAEEHCLPFQIKAPNKATLTAISELETGKGQKVDTLDSLLKDLDEKN